MRPSGRALDQLRDIKIQRGISRQAEGSCLITCGNTVVRITASLEDKPPQWLRGQNKGWVTAEYSMLPRATNERTRREVTSGKPSGRTQEIQRLIGRSLRSVIDMQALGERQIILDCDVLEADGGTRTACITGAYVALAECLSYMKSRGMIVRNPIRESVAAVSCGIYNGKAVLDLDYAEDSNAQTDGNFVLTASGKIVEIQTTAEAAPFEMETLNELIALAQKGIAELTELQRNCLNGL